MFGLRIKNKRLAMLLSQQELAHLARVSIASLQNIEANKANPSLSVLNRILDSLDLKLKIETKAIKEDQMFAVGVPVMANDINNNKATSYDLILILKKINAILIQELDERLLIASQSLILALKQHYPSFYDENIKPLKLIPQLKKFSCTGKHIKLRRIALSQVAKYL